MSAGWSNWHDQREWELALQSVAAAEAAYRPLLREFVDWARSERGLQPSSIHQSVSYIRRFLDWIPVGEDVLAAFRGLTPDRIESFFVELSRGSGYGTRRAFRTVVRRLLRFAVHRGWSDPRLVDAVPSLRTYRLAHVVHGIGDDQIRELLRSLPNTTPAEVRDRAILVMLAVYGARPGHLRSLRLEHVRWKERQILLPAHKGGKPVLHTLMPQVARPLARHVKEVRPEVPFKEVFVTSRRPYTPLGWTTISCIVRHRLARAGIVTVAKGSRIFRHAFASRLLRQRQPLKTIADLLGHRNLDSVAIYTKVDEPALREVATEWPEVRG